MFHIFFLSVLFLVVNSRNICNTCVCRYANKQDSDYQGDNVDCSYRVGVLDLNSTLPDKAHSLDLSWTRISTVPSASLLRSADLEELFLNNNLIVEIKPYALQLPELKSLDLSDNLLEFIEESTFRGTRNLQYLNLANNKFTKFSQLTFHYLSNLNEIILNNNNIGPRLQENNLFDRSGYGLTQRIKNLSISNINLNAVPDNFFVDAYDLRKLIISQNKITEMFELPFTLEYLDLSDNPIEEIESEDFNDLPALKVLKLNNLGLKEVPEFAFSALQSLTKLELERNKNLTVFSELAFGREVLDDSDDFLLESLSLKGSRLSKLDKVLSEPFGQLIHLDLQGNPWKCDCNILWVKDLQLPERDYDHLRCATPTPFFNARIFDLDQKYFTCAPNKHHVGAAVSVVALCVILGTIAVWLFVCVPKINSRSNFLRQMYSPSAAYSVLPMATNINSIND